MRPLTHLSLCCRLLWASPCSLVGMLGAALAMLFGAQLRWRQGALECCLASTGAPALWLARHQPFAAITLGHVILAVHAQDLQRLGAHERVHVKQYERWGALFFLAYPLASLWCWLKGCDPYRANYFEQQAYAVELQSAS